MRRSARRTVAKSAPPTTIHTPTPSTLVPMISMIRRKDSITAFIAGKRADFQCCTCAYWRNVEMDRLLRRRWRYARRGLRYQAAQPRPLANALRTTRSTFAQLSLKNDAGDRVVFSMAERDQGRNYASLCGECFGRSRKDKIRLAALFFSNVDVAPAHCFANTSAERFRHCLLASK